MSAWSTWSAPSPPSLTCSGPIPSSAVERSFLGVTKRILDGLYVAAGEQEAVIAILPGSKIRAAWEDDDMVRGCGVPAGNVLGIASFACLLCVEQQLSIACASSPRTLPSSNSCGGCCSAWRGGRRQSSWRCRASWSWPIHASLSTASLSPRLRNFECPVKASFCPPSMQERLRANARRGIVH